MKGQEPGEFSASELLRRSGHLGAGESPLLCQFANASEITMFLYTVFIQKVCMPPFFFQKAFCLHLFSIGQDILFKLINKVEVGSSAMHID